MLKGSLVWKVFIESSKSENHFQETRMKAHISKWKKIRALLSHLNIIIVLRVSNLSFMYISKGLMLNRQLLLILGSVLTEQVDPCCVQTSCLHLAKIICRQPDRWVMMLSCLPHTNGYILIFQLLDRYQNSTDGEWPIGHSNAQLLCP